MTETDCDHQQWPHFPVGDFVPLSHSLIVPHCRQGHDRDSQRFYSKCRPAHPPYRSRTARRDNRTKRHVSSLSLSLAFWLRLQLFSFIFLSFVFTRFEIARDWQFVLVACVPDGRWEGPAGLLDR